MLWNIWREDSSKIFTQISSRVERYSEKKDKIWLRVSQRVALRVSQNKLLTCLWYLNLGYTLRGLGVIQKFNNNVNDEKMKIDDIIKSKI